MKKQLLALALLVFTSYTLYAQNTFPTSGNAGIGTTAPGANLVIQAATPELRFITTADSTSFARFLRSTASSNNLFQGKNHVLQVGSLSNAVRFTNPAQTFSSTDDGIPSGTSITMTFSCVYRGANSNYTLLKWGNSTQYITIFAVATTFYVYYGGTRIFFGTLPNDSSNWHNLIFVMNGSSGTLYVDNVLNKTMTFEAAYNVVPGGAGSFKNGTAVTTPVDIDQVLIYTRALSRTSGPGSSDEIAQIYNAGAYTATPPTSGLIRRYEFEEGTGSSVADLNPNTTTYNLALNNSPTWLINSSIVPVGGSAAESTFFSVSDGLTNNERGVATWGDFNGRNQQQGKWFQWKQGSNYPLVSNNAGHWLFNPNRTIDTLANVASTIDVAGNLTVGSAYAGTNAAPADGLIVQGNTGIGTSTPAYPLQINEPLNGQGTISVTAGSGTVTGTGTKFLADFNVGDTVKANSETRIISAIASNTSMTTNNWTSTYNGVYTSTNAPRFTFSGKGTLYLGQPPTPSTTYGMITALKILNNIDVPSTGIISSILSSQTTGTRSNALTGLSASATILSSNTKSWTSTITGSSANVSLTSGARGSFNNVFANQSNLANASVADTLTNAAAYSGSISNKGLITNAYFINGGISNTVGFSTSKITNAYLYYGNYFNNTGAITNASGLYFNKLSSATNNTAIYLTTTATTNIPSGNWAIYDTTGYKNYFAGSIGIGTTNPYSYKLAVNGGVIATAVTVKAYANWPDYVFGKEHRLMPLPDLKAYVDKNQHLPEIPSAAEVEKNGQDLGEMNKLLVKKMEEMTLYMIEKDKQIKDQQVAIDAQELRLKALEQQIEKITKKD